MTAPTDASSYKAEVLKREELARLRAAAAPALDHPRPLDLFKESCRSMGLGGDLSLASTIYLAATTRVLDRRRRQHAHCFVLGPASAGKSFEMDAALGHLPPEAVETVTAGSPRSLIYCEADIQHRALVFAELDSLPLGNGGEEGDVANAALSFLRTLVVDGTASYDVVVRTKDGFSTRRYVKEGPATLIVTGTKRLSDEQLRSRLHEVELVVDKGRLRSVVAAQATLLEGGAFNPASEDIIAVQRYLQAQAPVRVVVPFAGTLGRLILDRAKVADPRLVRELARIAGFACAHALLSIDRRERDDDGNLVCTLEDYEAARRLIGDLGTTREFSKFALVVWEAIDDIHKATNKPVTVGALSKALLRSHNYIRSTVKTLLEGGALLDPRDHPSKTAPLLVAPAGDHPAQVPLPTVKDLLLGGYLPAGSCWKQGQVLTAQEASLNIEAHRLNIEANSMSPNDLGPLPTQTPGAIHREEASELPAELMGTPITDPHVSACADCRGFTGACTCEVPFVSLVSMGAVYLRPPGLPGCYFHPGDPRRYCLKCDEAAS